MKKYYSYFWFFVLTIYCVILISIEINTSQDFVRNFFADIQGDVPLYGINTSLSVFLLLGTALMFCVILVLPAPKDNLNRIKFYRSQVLLFTYLGLDDRFLIHEYFGYVLGINDVLILGGLGVLEIILILVWGGYQQWSKATVNYLLAAAFFLTSMLIIDGIFPSEMIARLSLEDLAKTWANTFIFLFSWSIFQHNLKDCL